MVQGHEVHPREASDYFRREHRRRGTLVRRSQLSKLRKTRQKSLTEYGITIDLSHELIEKNKEKEVK